MRQTKVALRSLGVGRCFTLPTDPPQPAGSGEQPGTALRPATPLLEPAAAWRVVACEGDAVEAESAAGERRRFAGEDLVVEVARQGWDRLRERRA